MGLTRFYKTTVFLHLYDSDSDVIHTISMLAVFPL